MKKIFILLLSIIPFGGMTQNTNISGIVTYYFNEYQGDKADIGAKVYIIDSIKNPEFDYELISNYLEGCFNKSLYYTYLGLFNTYSELTAKYEGKKKYVNEYEKFKLQRDDDKKWMDGYYSEMIKYGVETDEKFKELDKKTCINYNIVKNKENIIVKTIGANGDYSISLTPGVYYVLIISNNRPAVKRALTKVNLTEEWINRF